MEWDHSYTPFSNVEELVLVPMPMVRRCQVIQIIWYLLQSCGGMRCLNFKDTLALWWPNPFRRTDTIILRQGLFPSDVSTAHMESFARHSQVAKDDGVEM